MVKAPDLGANVSKDHYRSSDLQPLPSSSSASNLSLSSHPHPPPKAAHSHLVGSLRWYELARFPKCWIRLTHRKDSTFSANDLKNSQRTSVNHTNVFSADICFQLSSQDFTVLLFFSSSPLPPSSSPSSSSVFAAIYMSRITRWVRVLRMWPWVLLLLFVCWFFLCFALFFFFLVLFCLFCCRCCNPTIDVITFRLRGWCMLGVFVADIHLYRTWMSRSFDKSLSNLNKATAQRITIQPS